MDRRTIESNNDGNVKKTLLGINDVENLSSIFKGAIGNKLARQLMHLFGINKINAAYESACDYTGAAFATELLKNIGVHYQIGNIERLKELPEGAFITISNHPYGGIDGIMLIDLVASIRSDYKIMVNKILSLIKTMEENFISVTPTTNKKADDQLSRPQEHGAESHHSSPQSPRLVREKRGSPSYGRGRLSVIARRKSGRWPRYRVSRPYPVRAGGLA